MNSRSMFEKELKTLLDANSSSKVLDTKVAYFKAQHHFATNELPYCFKNLILNYVHQCVRGVEKKSCPPLEQLESLVSNELKLSLLAINNTLANSLRNDFYLGLLTLSQNMIDWLDKMSNAHASSGDDAASRRHLSTAHANTCFLLNNLSIVNFSLKKYALSCLFLKKSLNENVKICASIKRTDHEPDTNDHNNNSEERLDKQISFSNRLNEKFINRQYEILYNLGVSLLFNKQPIEAFECFLKVVDCYSQNGRLWLRLAECCIMCFRHSIDYDTFKSSNQFIKLNLTTSGNEKLFKLSEKIKCISRSFGSGVHHKIQIAHSLRKEEHDVQHLTASEFNSQSEQEVDVNMAKMLTLNFAYMCLQNGLNLIPSNQQIFANKSMTKSDAQGHGSSSSSSYSKLAAGMDTVTGDETNAADNAEAAGADAATVEETTNESSAELGAMSPNSLKQANLKKQHIQLQKLFNCVWPSKPLNMPQLQNLRCSLLVSLCYVSLCLKDYHSTVKYANLILDLNDPFNSICPPSNGNK